MEPVTIWIIVLCSLPLWFLSIGFVWFVRQYVSEAQTLKLMLNKLSSESSNTTQGTIQLGTIKESPTVIDIPKHPLTLNLEEGCKSSPTDDTAFQTPVDVENPYLHSPTNLKDVSYYVMQNAVLPSEPSSNVTDLLTPQRYEQQTAFQLHEEAEGMSVELQIEPEESLRKTLADSMPVLPELKYDIALMSFNPGELGRGGFGRVREAMYKDESGQVHHVAAKYPHEHFADAGQALRSELDMISKLPLHPNIVRYFGGRVSYQEDGTIEPHQNFIVMELMHTNLEKVVHGNEFKSSLNCSLALDITLDIINGLDHLHEYYFPHLRHGIIHYDLKPSNVLLNEDLNAKLADFGSSKRKLKSQTTASLKGTIGYIAPEVLVANFTGYMMPVNEKLDIFSLGVVMWEMLTGEYPPNLSGYTTSSQEFSTYSMCLVEPVIASEVFRTPDVSRCPEIFRPLLQDCLNFEAKLRPTIKEVRERLLSIMSTQC